MLEEPKKSLLYYDRAQKSLFVGRKKLLSSAALIAVALVVAGAGSALAFTSWYQNPDKVIADGVKSAIVSKTNKMDGTITVETGSTKVNLSFNGGNKVDHGGTLSGDLAISMANSIKLNLKADGVYSSDGDIYFKLKDVNEEIDKFIDAQYGQLQSRSIIFNIINTNILRDAMKQKYRSLASAVDNRWIKVKSSDLTQMGLNNKITCWQNAVKRIENESKTAGQIRDIYKDNPFLVVKEELGTKDGNIGFVVDIDADSLSKFDSTAREIAGYKELAECLGYEPSKVSSDANDRTELWFNQWSHALARVKSETNSASSRVVVDINNHPGEDIEINIPTDATDITELDSEIKSVLIFGR